MSSDFPPLNPNLCESPTPNTNNHHNPHPSNSQTPFLKLMFDLLSAKREKETGGGCLDDGHEILGKRGPLDRKLEEELAAWIRKEDHLEKPNSRTIRDKALELFQGSYPEFKASRGWYYNFLRRHKIRRYKSDILM